MQDWIAGKNDHLLARVLLVSLLAFALAALANAQLSVPWSVSLAGLILAATVLAGIVIAALFGVEARANPSSGLGVLAVGFGLASVALLIDVLAAPDLFAPFGGVLHLSAAAPHWLVALWGDTLATAIVLYAFVARGSGRGGRAAGLLLALGWLAALAAIIFSDPPTATTAPIGIGLAALATIASIVKRKASMLDLVLGVVGFAVVLETALTLISGTRFTVASYLALGDMFFAVIAVIALQVWHTAWLNSQLSAHTRELSAIAATDGLTGVSNRRRFEEEYLRAHGTASRRNGPMSLAIIDLDNFHAYNESYGHEAGDRALQMVADAVAMSALRRGDFVARYGGEEFVMILEDTDIEGAAAVAEKVRAAVLESAIESTENALLSVSIGVANRTPGETSEALLNRTATALGAAKEAGKNRVFVSRLGEAKVLA